MINSNRLLCFDEDNGGGGANIPFPPMPNVNMGQGSQFPEMGIPVMPQMQNTDANNVTQSMQMPQMPQMPPFTNPSMPNMPSMPSMPMMTGSQQVGYVPVSAPAYNTQQDAAEKLMSNISEQELLMRIENSKKYSWYKTLVDMPSTTKGAEGKVKTSYKTLGILFNKKEDDGSTTTLALPTKAAITMIVNEFCGTTGDFENDLKNCLQVVKVIVSAKQSRVVPLSNGGSRNMKARPAGVRFKLTPMATGERLTSPERREIAKQVKHNEDGSVSMVRRVGVSASSNDESDFIPEKEFKPEYKQAFEKTKVSNSSSSPTTANRADILENWKDLLRTGQFSPITRA